MASRQQKKAIEASKRRTRSTNFARSANSGAAAANEAAARRVQLEAQRLQALELENEKLRQRVRTMEANPGAYPNFGNQQLAQEVPPPQVTSAIPGPAPTPEAIPGYRERYPVQATALPAFQVQDQASTEVPMQRPGPPGQSVTDKPGALMQAEPRPPQQFPGPGQLGSTQAPPQPGPPRPPGAIPIGGASAMTEADAGGANAANVAVGGTAAGEVGAPDAGGGGGTEPAGGPRWLDGTPMKIDNDLQAMTVKQLEEMATDPRFGAKLRQPSISGLLKRAVENAFKTDPEGSKRAEARFRKTQPGGVHTDF